MVLSLDHLRPPEQCNSKVLGSLRIIKSLGSRGHCPWQMVEPLLKFHVLLVYLVLRLNLKGQEMLLSYQIRLSYKIRHEHLVV